MFKFYAFLKDGSKQKINCSKEKVGLSFEYKVGKGLNYSDIEYIDIVLNERIPSGENGYYLLSGGHGRCELKESAIGYFTEREDTFYKNVDAFLPIIGLKYKDNAFLAAVTGMRGNSCQIIDIKDNGYEFRFRVDIDFEEPYEEIKIRQFMMGEDTSYSAMARAYREYKLSIGFTPLKNRLNSQLRYAAESVYVRIRHGWKPVPCTILEQTEENEPPMHVACTFADVEEIIKEYKKQGIKKAEFCLVGWNIGGHDGRWPQILPPEESLGGEKALKKLIKTALDAGYLITCHTNSTDAYSIAQNFNKEDLAHDKNGNISIETEYWAGGRTYNICPKRAYEISCETLAEVADLGFRGLHYIDVITCTIERECRNPNHPVTKAESSEYFYKLFEKTRELFGGIASESAYEHSLKNCDFALYASFMRKGNMPYLFDEYVPFWHLVFHGIIISNPYSSTVNAAISADGDNLLKSIELGGRPVAYYYSRFVSDGTDWMGDIDFRTDSPEKIKNDTECLKKQADIYDEMSYLQFEFMESHEKVADNVYKTTYSDGSVVTVDYNNKTYSLKRGNVNV